MEVWNICNVHYLNLLNFFFKYANKFQVLEETENVFGSLDHQSWIGPTLEALTVVPAGSTLISKIRMSTSCGMASGVCVGSSLMRSSKVN